MTKKKSLTKKAILEEITLSVQKALYYKHTVLKITISQNAFDILKEGNKDATLVSVVQGTQIKTSLEYTHKQCEGKCSIWVDPYQSTNIKLKTRLESNNERR